MKQRKRPILKTLAIFMALNILLDTLLPTVAMALTAGPTAPEYTSFEPVDTTDMVNLLTGDMTYSVPLLEVPGPEGGYPLALSYHAGIKPDIEASWVGLGWSLNPGAINRTVNGYADDIYETKNTRRDYWKGGVSSTYGVGITIGPFGISGPSMGLQVSHDTYQGFGVGGNFGVSAGVNMGSIGLSYSTTVGISPYGESYMNMSVGASVGVAATEGMRLGGNLGVSLGTNGSSGFAGAGLSVNEEGRGQSLVGVGASMSSKGLKGSLRVGGASTNQSNARAGKITTQSSGFNLSIPTPKFSIDLSYNRTRYFSDEKSDVIAYGALYANELSDKSADSHSMDSYHLTDLNEQYNYGWNQNTQNINFMNYDPKEVSGGSFLSFDVYNVSAQGLGGTISPVVFKGMNLFTQNKKDGSNSLVSFHTNVENRHLGKTQFRFDNDFSNKLVKDASEFINSSDNTIKTSNPSYDTPSEGLHGNHLAGSRHIEWYTNEEIKNGDAKSQGFVDFQANNLRNLVMGDFILYDINDAGLSRNASMEDKVFPRTDISKHIGGYTITNESGVNYHYALPVYTYGEYRRIQKISDPVGSYTKIENPDAYAYTWLLTAVTGPDYVDKNNNGIADAGDWGYWVKMDYGKWTDRYTWRTPARGTTTDLENEFETITYGYKQLFYLNKISTRTHSAIFVKSIRNDAKGSSDLFRQRSQEMTATGVTNPRDTQDRNGNFLSKNVIYERGLWGRSNEKFEYRHHPVSSLRLEEIYLIKNSDLKNFGSLCDKSSTYEDNREFDMYLETWSGWKNYKLIPYLHQGKNVIDIHDITTIQSQLETKMIRKIKLYTDYSLMEGTPNSFISELDVMNTNKIAEESDLTGKLTLNSIEVLGKGGTSILPPTQFGYESDEPKKMRCTVQAVDAPSETENRGYNKVLVTPTYTGLPHGFEVGDIITYQHLGKKYYILLRSVERPWHIDDVQFEGQVLGGDEIYGPFLETKEVVETKNPPYQTDATDIWGYYKSDYNPSIEKENFRRIVSEASSKSVDSWSLRNITTSLGAKVEIEYESDSYEKNILNKNYALEILGEPEAYGSEHTKLSFDIADLPFALQDIYKPEYVVCALLAYSERKCTLYNLNNIPNVPPCMKWENVAFAKEQTYVISEVGDDYLIVRGGVSTNCIGGNLAVLPEKEVFGGGLRVSSIRVKIDNNGIQNITNYKYEIDNHSSGVTAYEPINMNSYNKRMISDNNIQHDWYGLKMHASVSKILENARELPAPGVMYSHISVSEEVKKETSVKNIPTSTTYHFEVFNKDMVQLSRGPWRHRSIQTQDSHINFDDKKTSIKDYTVRIGRLLDVTTFDVEGRILNQTVNHYLDDTEKLKDDYNDQGVITQSFTELKDVGSSITIGAISHKTVYPNVLIGTTQKDFRSNTTVSSKTLAFDFYSGTATEVLTEDAYGNHYKTKVIPAYTLEPYKNGEADRAGMGLKVRYNDNKNMLTQNAASYTYKVSPTDPNQILDVVSASVNTWQDQWSYREKDTRYAYTPKENDAYPTWRAHQNYVWRSDFTKDNGITANFTDFNWANPDALAEGWTKVSEITSYDRFSHALEMKDINNKYIATRMDAKNEMVLASVANAKYADFSYSGFENTEDGEIITNSGTVVSTKAHTGLKSMKLATGNSVFYQRTSSESEPNVVSDLSKKYVISYWTHGAGVADTKPYYLLNTGISHEATAYQESKKVVLENGETWYWNRAILEIPTNVDAFTMGVINKGNADVYVDDLRMYPMKAVMTSYVYNQHTGELTYILDANNFFTKFEYDAAGKLKRTSKESLSYGVKVVSDYHYNYKNK